ncbi:EscU/YscU/HrcU family type III secretion system export apparatus switch protein [Catenovulum sediminis]|uniref:Flagellar biosynthetic protein FlhB n=1 Tax=Catenovulum sediminis TaxID=1740262 RepID=A0ABV1RKS3_9ALTE|nr:EscU/YscU/HrcU family type III secretion system export apparatus switch protein [Catenovulum sediminis]
MNKTPTATKAVALTYDAPDTPKVTAKGYDQLAVSIIEQAREHGVMVHEDTELANYLSRMEVGSEIPYEIYVIVAELIAWSYILRGEQPENWNNIHHKIDHKV